MAPRRKVRYVTDSYQSAPLPNVSDEVSEDLAKLAVQHDSFENFRTAMMEHAGTIWDNSEVHPVALDGLSDTTSGQLSDLARQHAHKTTFLQEMERIASRVWHNVKNRGHAPAGHAAGDTHEPSKPYPDAG